ncbi:hypothetical protein I3843_01G026700 [Carya illinoinensis]|uniref:Uncharacterized protein n=1 Tax=Carya illinoinensis TaxID=32201 RepID=A0A922G1C2_CARIL|nr:hypothetical protein I3842_01G030600 [Carya illinoinensis]KAG7993845.1 hypothetical protein I3843_01G026700 [Carya illinoinensis]
MGACVSSQEIKTSKSRGKLEGIGRGQRQAQEQADWCNNKQQSKTTKVINMNYGWLHEIKLPMQAKAVTSQNPNCFLCSSDSLYIGKCPTQVPPEEELQPGHIYFLMPLSQAHLPLSLPDLCALAIKVTSALGKNGVDFSSIR